MIGKKERAHYVLEFRDKESWMELTIWEFLPTLFSRFLDYVFKINGVQTTAEKQQFRVRRIEYSWGQADYRFDGRNHLRVKNDEGYTP